MGRKNIGVTYRQKPDLLYGDVDIEKFINIVMIHGKKDTARAIVYYALQDAHKKIGDNSLSIANLFSKIVQNASPGVEVKRKRVGGATYQVPTELKPQRAKILAMRFLQIVAKKTRKSSMKEALANEFYEVFFERGEVIRMKEEKHKIAKSNMAYAHYA